MTQAVAILALAVVHDKSHPGQASLYSKFLLTFMSN